METRSDHGTLSESLKIEERKETPLKYIASCSFGNCKTPELEQKMLHQIENNIRFRNEIQKGNGERMIRLEVEDYCHECRAFQPDVEESVVYSDVFGNEVVKTDTVVRCKTRKLCKRLVEYLKSRLNEREQGHEQN